MPIGFPSSPTLNQTWPDPNPTRIWDGEKWVAIAGQLVTDQLPLPVVNTDQLLVLRNVSGIPTAYLLAMSDLATYVGGAPAAIAPATFTILQWDLEPIVGGLRFTISELPADGGSAITSLEYRLNSGSWVAFSAAIVGTYDVTSLPTTLHTAEVRAVNAVGAGDPSDTKSETPTASGGGTLTISQGTGADIVGGESSTYRSGGGTNVGYWEPGVTTSRMLWRPGSGFNTTNIPGVIATAVFRIYMVQQFGASTVTAYNNLRDWVAGAGTPTWAEYAPSTAWEVPGGSGPLDRSASSVGTQAAPGADGVWVEISLDPAVVETWRQAGGVGACGLQLDGSGQYSTFHTDTNVDDLATRPQLVVTYT